MVNLLSSVVFGAVFGLALAAPPGPMNAVIAQESVLRGWVAGFRAGLGAMTADLCFLVLSLLGVVAFVGSMPRLRGVMVGVGGLLMLWFAYGAVRDATGGVDWDTDVEGRGFRKAFALALTNPYQILFWLTAGVGMLESGRADVLGYAPYLGESLSGTLVVETGTPALIVGFFLGIALWIVGFPASLVAAGQRLDRFSRAVAYLSATVLAGFGTWFLVDAAGTLL
ncbi:MAG: LysE family translocator [Halobacteriales archaeon]